MNQGRSIRVVSRVCDMKLPAERKVAGHSNGIVPLRIRTDRNCNRLCEPKAASGREASEGQRAGQGSTESAADIS